MSGDKQREALVKDLIEGNAPNKKKFTDSQLFVQNISECKSIAEIAMIVAKTMSLPILEDRLSKISSNRLIVAFNAAKDIANAGLGFKLRHEDLATIALDHSMKVLESENVSEVKKELTKEVAKEEKTRNIIMQQGMDRSVC